MAVNTNLIHAGLPWSSPLKIIVQASEVINDATINRGLLNLLNNDYYLDIKTQALNNYIENNIIGHIADTSIHFTKQSIIQLIGSNNFLTQNTIVSIPVIFLENQNATIKQTAINIEKINSFINMLPRQLNGYTLIVQFVYATKITDSVTVEETPKISIDVSSLPIVFNGFSNGTLIIRSNSDIQQAIKSDDINSINNINTLMSISNFNEKLTSIINDLQDTAKISEKIISAFTLSGTGINMYYSSLCFTDCTADIYLTNLNIINSLSAFTQSAINAARLNSQNKLPSKSQVAGLFLCNYFTNDKIIYAQQNQTDSKIFNTIDSLALKINTNAQSTDLLSSIISSNTFLTLNKNTQSYSIPDYLQFTNFDNLYLTETAIRPYLYGLDTSDNFSICFFANLSSNASKIQNVPLFSDTIINADNDLKGLSISLNQIYSNFIGENANVAAYNGTYQSSESLNFVSKKTCFYVIDFLTTNTTVNDRSCYKVDEKYRTVNPGKMRINVSVYSIDTKDSSTGYYSQQVYIPDITKGDYNFSQESNYTFTKPTESTFLSQQRSIKFFANKIRNGITDTLFNWNYFSGSIRNILFFKKILTYPQVNAIISKRFSTAYYWNTTNDSKIVENISTSSYIGALNINNSNHVNIIKNYIATQAIK